MATGTERWIKACAAIRAAMSNTDTEQCLRVSGHEPQSIADAFAIGQASDLIAWAFGLSDEERRSYLAESAPDCSGPAIPARAAAHQAITPDELPGHIAAMEEARNGPNALSLGEGDEHLCDWGHTRAVPPGRMMEEARSGALPTMHDFDAGEGARSALAPQRPVLFEPPPQTPGDDAARSAGAFGFGGPAVTLDPIRRPPRSGPDAAQRIREAEAMRAARADLAASGFVQREMTSHERTIAALERNNTSLVEQRNAYRDRLRKMLGVTKPDGEDLIALVEKRYRAARGALSIADQERDAALARLSALSARLCAIASSLGANLPEPGQRDPEDAALRIELEVITLQRDHASTVLSRDRWMVRARKAEGKKGKRGKRKGARQ